MSQKSEGAGKGKKDRKNKSREILECLLVAVALALTIRHFGFQIFKIPTRSMEPTLYGHNDYGDRVVAMMWYKRGGFLPLKMGEVRRWQVIVFNHRDNNNRPTHFIKRLVGLPGEEVEIRDGDIWVRAPGELEPEIARKPRELQETLWIKLCDLDFSNPDRLAAYWEHRPAGAAKVADGRLVLEPPSGGGGRKRALLRWNSERGIDNRYIRPSVVNFAATESGATQKSPCGHAFRAVFDTARPVVFCPHCNRRVYGVTDSGYAGQLEHSVHFWSEQEMRNSRLPSQVSDLRLAMDFEVLSGSGRLDVVLVGRSESYRFGLPLGKAGASAALSVPGQPAESHATALAAAGSHHLEVSNVDGEFRAELDGQAIGPILYGPPMTPGFSDAEISLEGPVRLAVDNLKLYRDIYYGFEGGAMTSHDQGNKVSYIKVPRGRYFFLGDNSLASQDGRYFGTKEERDLVARGVFVVWPPSRMHWVK